ncbi:MAG: AmmeMemoRadiSam system protein A, partial [bacterium]
MLAAKQLGADKINVLKYANSGDVARDKSRVVGYSASAITKTTLEKGGTKMLNKAQQEQLLKIARQTIETYLTTRKKPDFNITDKDLQDEQGAFVTLHKNGDLKGCIGNIIGRQPLWETVRDMAIESATGDPRFSPVTKEELKDIDIEISVLTKPERVKSADQIIMGTHGVIVRKGFSSGVFLPQVATETGWSKEEFLSYLCSQKAGLPAEAWKDKDTELYIFSAQVFGEKHK